MSNRYLNLLVTYQTRILELDAEKDQLIRDLHESLERLRDIYRNDDGDAWPEAARFMERMGREGKLPWKENEHAWGSIDNE